MNSETGRMGFSRLERHDSSFIKTRLTYSKHNIDYYRIIRKIKFILNKINFYVFINI